MNELYLYKLMFMYSYCWLFDTLLLFCFFKYLLIAPYIITVKAKYILNYFKCQYPKLLIFHNKEDFHRFDHVLLFVMYKGSINVFTDESLLYDRVINSESSDF